MYCSSCGKNIPHESNFCKHCGARITSAVPQPQRGSQKSDTDILVDEIGQVVAKGADISDKIGAFIGVESVPGTGLAGSLGAQLSARLLPNDTYEIVIQISASTASVCSLVIDILNKDGKLVDSQDISGSIEIRGVVGSGFLNMNPAVIRVAIFDSGSGQTQVKIQGSAKEGLIKQHAGKKAAERLAQQLLTIP